MRKLLSSLALLAAIALSGAGALTTSGCGAAGSTFDPVAKAADATSRTDGAQVALTMRISGEGLPATMTMKGQGNFNLQGNEGQLVLSMDGLPAEMASRLRGGMTEIYKGGVGYVRSPVFDGKLPHGARWLKIDMRQMLQSEGLSPSSLTSSGVNPSQYLQYLKARGASLSPAGHEVVRGVQTTRYSGSFDLIKASEQTPGANPALVRKTFEKLMPSAAERNVPVSVWIDAHDLVRRLLMQIKMEPSGQPAELGMTMEFFAFGATPSVNPPSDSETFDITKSVVEASKSS